jgi:hypothetical protein
VSLPSPYVWIPWRCYIWSTWIGRAARASQEGREQLHCLLPLTRSSTSRRFRCICASSGNPVISDSSSSCFAGKFLFCASVATPFPFNNMVSLGRQPRESRWRRPDPGWVKVNILIHLSFAHRLWKPQGLSSVMKKGG